LAATFGFCPGSGDRRPLAPIRATAVAAQGSVNGNPLGAGVDLEFNYK
jgi:hypothetical protein